MPAHWLRPLIASLAFSLAAGGSAHGAPLPRATPSPAPGADMDYGPFLTGSLDRDRAVSERDIEESTEQEGNRNALAAKAVVVRFGAGGPDSAAIAFDTDLLRYAAGWTGGFVNLDKTHLATMKGSVPLAPAGKLVFVTPALGGWTAGETFTDPRPGPSGPLPKSAGHYKGLYRYGGRVVFSYSVGDCDVLDAPGFETINGRPMFTRTIRVGPTKQPLSLMLAEQQRDLSLAAGVSVDGAPNGSSLGSAPGGWRKVLSLPAKTQFLPATRRHARPGEGAPLSTKRRPT